MDRNQDSQHRKFLEQVEIAFKLFKELTNPPIENLYDLYKVRPKITFNEDEKLDGDRKSYLNLEEKILNLEIRIQRNLLKKAEIKELCRMKMQISFFFFKEKNIVKL